MFVKTGSWAQRELRAHLHAPTDHGRSDRHPTWASISTSGMLSADASLVFTDPTPPATSKAFYRIDVMMR
jgi:hypothetical protein